MTLLFSVSPLLPGVDHIIYISVRMPRIDGSLISYSGRLHIMVQNDCIIIHDIYIYIIGTNTRVGTRPSDFLQNSTSYGLRYGGKKANAGETPSHPFIDYTSCVCFSYIFLDYSEYQSLFL